MKALQCPKTFPQIEEDLKLHKIIDLSTLREKMLKKFAKHHSICHYVIKSNKIYRECHGSIIDFKMFMDAPLLSLARKASLIYQLIDKFVHYCFIFLISEKHCRDIWHILMVVFVF